MRKRMRVWITKYALTDGVFEVEAERSEETPNMVGYRVGGSFAQYAHGNDWHATREEAEERAHEMLNKKIKSVEKQLTRLRGLQIKYLALAQPSQSSSGDGQSSNSSGIE